MARLSVAPEVAVAAVDLYDGGCHHNSFRQVNGPQQGMRPLWEKRHCQAPLGHAAA